MRGRRDSCSFALLPSLPLHLVHQLLPSRKRPRVLHRRNGNALQCRPREKCLMARHHHIRETHQNRHDLVLQNVVREVLEHLVYTKLSPNHSGQRTHSIDRITPHCVVGQLSAESICGCFISTSRQASCNYGIGTDGRISMSVEEKNRSWCSSSRENDQRAVTIECASDKTAPYAFNDAVYASLVNLCVDICQRNGKSKLLWLGDKNKTLAYAPKSDEMVLTVHRWFANKSCPGDWLYNRLGNLAAEVTKRLTGGSTDTGKVDVPSDSKTLYRVQTGAFSNRSNADTWAAKLKAAGFDTYIVQMGNLYKVQVGAYSQKSNAENMMTKLKAAGYDAFITTKSGTAAGTAKKSAAEIAKEIYNGTCSDARWSSWGNGADRVNRLKQAGYDPSEVQSEVNKLF